MESRLVERQGLTTKPFRIASEFIGTWKSSTIGKFIKNYSAKDIDAGVTDLLITNLTVLYLTRVGASKYIASNSSYMRYIYIPVYFSVIYIAIIVDNNQLLFFLKTDK